jgi:hypothetical protein
MRLTTEIKLDLARNGSPPTVWAKQNDSSTRYIRARLLESGADFVVETGVQARIRVLKPDNTAIYNIAEIDTPTAGGTYVDAELTSQALAVPGVAIAEIGLYNGQQILTTFVFYLRVERSAVSDEQIESTDEFTVLEQAIQNANTAATAANTAADQANAATATANTAAGNAIAARIAANTAAAAANTAADQANSAATAANTAAAAANAATATANTAAGDANTARTAANTAATAANTAADRANAAAAAVGEVIDGVALKSTDTGTTYIVKLRITDGAPLALVSEL